MSQPITKKSVDGATAAETGGDTRSLGHFHVTLFVVAKNFDGANDTLTVTLEGSPNRQDWDGLKDDQGNLISIDENDLVQDDDGGNDVYSVTHRGAYYEHLRANLTAFSDNASGDLAVDAWVMAGGNAGQGRKGTQRQGAISP